MAAAGAKEHLRFCQIDGWSELKSARGQGRDHTYLVKELPDGTVLRTKVSHGTKGKEAYSRGLWVHILKEQLQLQSEEEFWAVLKLKRPAQRQEVEETQQEALPVWLVQILVYTVKVHPERVAQMTLEEAEEAWLEFQTRPALEDLGSAPRYQPSPELEQGLQLSA